GDVEGVGVDQDAVRFGEGRAEVDVDRAVVEQVRRDGVVPTPFADVDVDYSGGGIRQGTAAHGQVGGPGLLDRLQGDGAGVAEAARRRQRRMGPGIAALHENAAVLHECTGDGGATLESHAGVVGQRSCPGPG